MKKQDNTTRILFDQPGPRGKKRILILNCAVALLLVAAAAHIFYALRHPQDGENQLSWELWKPAIDGEAWDDFYLPGLWATVRASVVAVIGSVVFGLFFGVLRLVPNFLVRWIASAVIEFCRAVPVLLLMIFMWRAFAFMNFAAPSYWAVVLSLIMYNGSVVAELVRSGVGNLPHGQREAGLALGLTRTQSLMTVEVPQAITAMLPAAVTQLVVVLKDTALGSIIMYTDLLQESRRLGSLHFNILQTLIVAGIIYFIVCFALSVFAQKLPERIKDRTSGAAAVEPVAPIAVMDPSNTVAVAAAQAPLPNGGSEPLYADYNHGAANVNEEISG